MSTPPWHRVAAASDIRPGTLRTFKDGHVQIAVGRTGDGALFAVDNRCPHEGYPLAQGALKDCVLTCEWHNWKFDVARGACLLGGEGVRTWPVRERDGFVEVDLTPPDLGEEIPRFLISLEEALVDGDLGRALRDGVRLLQGGLPPEVLLAELCRLDALYGEYGTSHVLPVSADVARRFVPEAPLDTMTGIGPVMALWIEGHRRRPRRPTAPARPGDAAAFQAAVEDEDLELAEGILRQGFLDGRPLPELEAWLFEAMSHHFTDFGHELIYLVKSRELLDRLPEDRRRSYAEAIFVGLNASLVLATREDTLPYLKGYFVDQADVEARPAPPEPPPPLPRDLRRAILDGSRAEALDALKADLRLGHRLEDLAAEGVAAAAHRLLRFDTAVAADPDISENWLWASHRLTFAAAARHAVRRWEDPRAVRFLFQSLAFVHSGKDMDLPPERRTSVAPRGPGAPDAVLAAIVAKDVDAAVGAAAQCLAGDRAHDLPDALIEWALDDTFVRPIVVAHALKTAVVAFEEREALGEDPDRDVAVLATVRFLASPIVERPVQALVRRSVRWVAEGIMPRKLTQ